MKLPSARTLARHVGLSLAVGGGADDRVAGELSAFSGTLGAESADVLGLCSGSFPLHLLLHIFAMGSRDLDKDTFAKIHAWL